MEENALYDVAIAHCAEYEPEACRRALEEAIAAVDGLCWLRPGMKVAVKVNLVSFLRPEAAATTHPVLLCALVDLLRERGASVVVGDSPGGIYNNLYVSRVYHATGMEQAQTHGAVLNRNSAQAEASYPQAVQASDFSYTQYLDEADAIIDFCKLKTHGMMGMFAAAKNLFGAIPGTLKPEYHFRFPEPMRFADMLVDLDEYFHPALSLCDAVVGMEGNGPTMGTPRAIGAVLASRSPHRLDLAAAALIGLSREQVLTLEAAYRRGLIPESVAGLSIHGDLASHTVPDFKTFEALGSLFFERDGGGVFDGAVARFMRGFAAAIPLVNRLVCVGCGECARVCPAQAITMRRRLPAIDRSRCIRCFCCQEFCPKGAMQVHRRALARLLQKL